VLAAEAAASGLPIERLIMWEPPFSIDPDGPRRATEYSDRLTELLDANLRDDALVHFMRQVGVQDEVIAGIRQSPYWRVGLSLAHTLAYDAAIMGDSTIPAARFAQIRASTLVLAGSESPGFLQQAAAQTAAAIPRARVDVLQGQDHNVAGEAIAPVVAAFVGR
jgi:pimeloyl-ACP methyl ester carboxylesterase